MKFLFESNKTSAAIMLRSFLSLLTAVIVIFSCVIILAIGHQLLETSRQSSANIITSLQKTVIDGNHDWQQWRFNSTLDTSTSYVRVHNTRKDAKTEYYYSPGTKKLLKIKPSRIIFIRDLYYQSRTGFLLFKTGNAKGIKYNLWIRLNSQIEILERVIIITVIILILTLLTLPLYIHLIAQRLTNPLAKLTKSSQKISANNFKVNQKLPVPSSPSEVKQLAKSFNHLLENLYYQNSKEKLFVVNAAHELRTPIATIQSHIQLIQRHGQNHPEIVSRSLQYIYSESSQMSELIKELLILSKADDMKLALKKFNLSQSLTEIVAKIKGAIQQPISIQIPAQIFLNAHQQSVEQIVTDLLSNASKYSEKNAPIKLVVEQKVHQIIIRIIDQGIGIPSQEKSHIFERFYRSSNVRGSIAGTGLGLAIANQLAALNHAQILVTDNQPHGSIFSIIFHA